MSKIDQANLVKNSPKPHLLLPVEEFKLRFNTGSALLTVSQQWEHCLYSEKTLELLIVTRFAPGATLARRLYNRIYCGATTATCMHLTEFLYEHSGHLNTRMHI